MSKELISVIVPIYMGEQWLHRCVESIRNQSFSDLEIILVNDGSPDNCGKICDKYALTDERIKVVHKENGGLSDARNAGISAADGEYIMFVDEDDYIHPRMAEILYQTMNETKSDIVVCDFCSVADEEKIEYPQMEEIESPLCFEGQEVMNQLYYRNLITVVAWNKLYKKQVFDSHGYIKGRINDDESAIHYILHACKKTAYIKEKLYYYVQREGSITNKRKWTYYSDEWLAHQERLRFLQENGYDQMAFFTKEHMLHYAVANYDKVKGSKHAKEIAKKMHSEFKQILNSSEMQQKLSEESKKKYKYFAIHPRFYRVYIGAKKILDNCVAAIKRPIRVLWRFFYGKIYTPLYRTLVVIPRQKRVLKEKYHLTKDVRNVVIFGSANHGNLGDYAIGEAEKRLFQRKMPQCNVFDVNMTDCVQEVKCLQKLLKKEDLLVLTGGGNLGNQYMDDETIRRNVITGFPHNQIVMFPQTFYFTSDETGRLEKEKTVEIYNAHSHLYLAARDEQSYHEMKAVFKGKIVQLPDVVLTMRVDCAKEKKGALLVLRNDVEGILQSSAKEEAENILKQEFGLVTVTDTVLPAEIPMSEFAQEFLKKLEQFKQAQLVVTDRLHGMVFSAITQTPCIVLGTYNHKVEEAYKWLKHLDYIKFLQQPAQIPDAIRELKNKKDCIYDAFRIDACYDDFFKMLLSDKEVSNG